MKSKKVFLLVLVLVALFLVSCGAPITTAPISTETFTPEPTATQTLLPTSTITPAPTRVGGGSGRIIFTYRKDEFLATFPELQGETNIFLANIDGTNQTPITNGLDGYNYLMDVSPDGGRVLIASTSNNQDKEASLYIVDLTSSEVQAIKLAEGLPNYFGRNSSAKWVDNSQVIYIGQGEEGFGIYSIGIDGSNSKNIYQPESSNMPHELLGVEGTRIYWGTKTQETWCDIVSEVWWVDINDSTTHALESNGKQISFCNVLTPELSFSPDGSKVAWVTGGHTQQEAQAYLNIAPTSDIDNPFIMEVLSSSLNLKWFPDGSKILVYDLGSVRQWPTEQNPQLLDALTGELFGVYEVAISSDLPTKNYQIVYKAIRAANSDKLMDVYEISPDSTQFIASLYEKNDQGNYITNIKYFDISSLTFYDVSGLSFTDTPLDGIYWIP